MLHHCVITKTVFKFIKAIRRTSYNKKKRTNNRNVVKYACGIVISNYIHELFIFGDIEN